MGDNQMSKYRLPERYRQLERFAEEWILPSQTARLTKRLASKFADLRALYDAMTPLLPEILVEFNNRPISELTAEENNLLELSYSLAMIAPAVEFFGQPAVACGFDARKFLPTHEPVANRPAMSVARESFL